MILRFFIHWLAVIICIGLFGTVIIGGAWLASAYPIPFAVVFMLVFTALVAYGTSREATKIIEKKDKEK